MFEFSKHNKSRWRRRNAFTSIPLAILASTIFSNILPEFTDCEAEVARFEALLDNWEDPKVSTNLTRSELPDVDISYSMESRDSATKGAEVSVRSSYSVREGVRNLSDVTCKQKPWRTVISLFALGFSTFLALRVERSAADWIRLSTPKNRSSLKRYLKLATLMIPIIAIFGLSIPLPGYGFTIWVFDANLWNFTPTILSILMPLVLALWFAFADADKANEENVAPAPLARMKQIKELKEELNTCKERLRAYESGT